MEASKDQQVPNSGADLAAGKKVAICTEPERFGIQVQPTQERLLESRRKKLST